MLKKGVHIATPFINNVDLFMVFLILHLHDVLFSCLKEYWNIFSLFCQIFSCFFHINK